MMPNGMPLLKCADLHKSYKRPAPGASALEVLKGISLEINEGEFISIVGASGSGKSTLLHILGGLDRPTSGNLYWSGEEIFSWSDDRLARTRGESVGFVFQFHHLLPEFSALENVMIPQMIAGVKTGAAKARASELLARVGVGERLDHRPSELSGGEQQRIAVARALANRPKIIFADEPSGNLDSENSRLLYELFAELNAKDRQTFVIVTHNADFAGKSKKVYKMADGKLERERGDG